MAKRTYTVWLKNLSPGSQYYWGEGTMYVVGNNLVEYFNQICAKTKEYNATADFSWEPAASKIQEDDLLVYVLPTSGQSIVAKKTTNALGPTGSTFPTATGVISEIYLDVMQGDRDFARLVANAIFHEWMHNKLDAYSAGAPVQDIHVQGGGALATGGLIKSGDRPSPRNISLMAANLSRKHPQYTADLAKVSPYP
jgi:hypothetical protein